MTVGCSSMCGPLHLLRESVELLLTVTSEMSLFCFCTLHLERKENTNVSETQHLCEN